MKVNQIVTLKELAQYKKDHPEVNLSVVNEYANPETVTNLEVEGDHVNYTYYNNGLQHFTYPADVRLKVTYHRGVFLEVSRDVEVEVHNSEPAEEAVEEVVTLKELAFELGTTPKGLRKWLRDNKFPKPGKRWEWPTEDSQLSEIREQRKTPRKAAKKQAPSSQELVKKMESNGKKLDQTIVKATKRAEKPRKIVVIGKWEIWKNPENGAMRAIYNGPNSTDKTPWITSKSEVRKSLPKKIKFELEVRLPN